MPTLVVSETLGVKYADSYRRWGTRRRGKIGLGSAVPEGTRSNRHCFATEAGEAAKRQFHPRLDVGGGGHVAKTQNQENFSGT